VVLDDLGVDKVGAYHELPPDADVPCTPHLDALAAEGMLFRRAWANPMCSPTRAQILTGRHAFRTGVGMVFDHAIPEPGLSPAERTLPRILEGYQSALVGKWHLSGPVPGALSHPLDCGFSSWAGTLFNIATPAVALGAETPPDCGARGPLGYSNWVKVAPDPETGELRQGCTSTYATTDTVDDAIARAATLRAPWFLEVSFNAAHQPASVPPEALWPPEDCRSKSEEPRFLVNHTMIAALDAELGRMLASIRALDPGVIVIVLADNGTSVPAAQGARGSCFAPERSKGTLYESGVRVPLIVAGPGIAHGESQALVAATDVYATLAELAGVVSTAEDSVSFVPALRGAAWGGRDTVYAEVFKPNFPRLDGPDAPEFRPDWHERALRDARYKLVLSTRKGETRESLYDLERDPCETRDLLADPETPLEPEAAEHRAALGAALDALGVGR